MQNWSVGIGVTNAQNQGFVYPIYSFLILTPAWPAFLVAAYNVPCCGQFSAHPSFLAPNFCDHHHEQSQYTHLVRAHSRAPLGLSRPNMCMNIYLCMLIMTTIMPGLHLHHPKFLSYRTG